MRNGFTLIELLVVVTIIVVLLALLTPALDKAIYQAELATCGGGLKAIGSGLLGYATANRREYPERPLQSLSMELAAPTTWAGDTQEGVDNRPALRRALGGGLNKLLNCPLQSGIDLESPSANTHFVAGGYAIWNQWSTAQGEKTMRRLGDRWTYQGDSFSLLANDYEMRSDVLYSTHPDYDGLMTETAYQDFPWITQKRDICVWLSGNGRRGLQDRNFLHGDGAVEMLGQIKEHNDDERMTTVPYFFNGGEATATWERIPR